LKAAQTDREEAKSAIAKATALRNKEEAEYAKVSGDFKTNIAGMGKAIAAIESGAGGFLQMSAINMLKNISITMDLNAGDRDTLASFLSEGNGQSNGYAPASGEITGILKEMKDTMTADLADATAKEKEAIGAFDSMSASKKKEIQALTDEIEAKTVRHGEAKVELVSLKNDLDDTSAALLDDQKFLKEMDKSCSTKEGEWAERQKMRAEEMLAIHETIKILNDDDALELFKKTLPSASLLQVTQHMAALRQRAISALESPHKGSDVRIDFIAMALKGKKVNMDKVVKMVDDMIVLLGKEQVDDDSKKEYCETSIDAMEDKIKELERKSSDLEKGTEDAKGAVETLANELKALEEGIEELDKQVAEATGQRKDEHAEFVETTAANNAAVELLGFAKNRLNKFYNPSQYKAPPKRELSREDRIAENMAGSALVDVGAKPAPAPETFEGEYKKKGEESSGVIALVDMLVADVQKEITEMEVEEKNSQEEYEKLMSDGAAKRASDTKSIAEKEGNKADLEAKLLKYEEDTLSTKKETVARIQVLGDLHAECDWLLQNYNVRKEARAGEVDALKKAKAVLSGADFSLLQVPSFMQVASVQAPEDKLAAEMTHDLEMNFNKIAPFGKEDTAKELQDHAAKTQDTLVDAVENAEVAEIKRAVFRALTRLRAATIKEFDTIARLETQAIDAYNDAHHYRAENPLAHLHEDEAPVETDKLKSFH